MKSKLSAKELMCFATVEISEEWAEEIGVDDIDINGKTCIVDRYRRTLGGWVSVSFMTMHFDEIDFIELSLKEHMLTRVEKPVCYKKTEILKYLTIKK